MLRYELTVKKIKYDFTPIFFSLISIFELFLSHRILHLTNKSKYK